MAVVLGNDFFKKQCPGEPWYIHCHVDMVDYDQDSFGATAGFLDEGTELTVLDHGEQHFQCGPFAGTTQQFIQVQGLGGKDTDHEGVPITGWVVAAHIDLRADEAP